MVKRFGICRAFPGDELDDDFHKKYFPTCWFGLTVQNPPNAEPIAYMALMHATAASAQAKADEQNRSYYGDRRDPTT